MIINRMIHYLQGNILESGAEALVNTVNTKGVMGKGIALQFKKAFPANFNAYAAACKSGLVAIGKLFLSRDRNLETGEKVIINFPTKDDWRKSSEYIFIEKGLDNLIEVIKNENINSIAIPPLGAGNGGLEWEKVKGLIERKLEKVPIEIFVYEPNVFIKDQLKKERIKLTDARALLLYVLYDLVKQGEFVSEFSSEKVCYFLQRFGAEKYFKLHYNPNFYGPYSGKVRFVLNALNGSYLMGYSDMNKKPFEPLTLIADGYQEVKELVENNPELFSIAAKTTQFLKGFYADFSLELLSSLDYLTLKYQSYSSALIAANLESWSERKRTMFSRPEYVEIGLRHLEESFSSKGMS